MCYDGHLDRAVKMFDTFRSQGCKITVPCYRLVLAQCLAHVSTPEKKQEALSKEYMYIITLTRMRTHFHTYLCMCMHTYCMHSFVCACTRPQLHAR